MSNLIAVWENDRCAHLYCRHVRNELFVALVDDGLLFRRCARSAGGSSIGNGIGTRPAFVVLDDDLQRPGHEIAGENQNSKQHESARRPHLNTPRRCSLPPSGCRIATDRAWGWHTRSRAEPTRTSSVARQM